MNYEQIFITLIVVSTLILFLWGKWRFDIVSFAALLATALLGLIPFNEAFKGFSHPATITVVEVLILSQALKNSGLIQLLKSSIKRFLKYTTSHIAALSSLGAFLSMFMNNVGAITLLIPTAVSTSLSVRRSPSTILMPLSFATILGGLVTLMGTPPNIIIASYRKVHLGESFNVFDFAYVGLPVAIVGIIYVTLIGWRLLPQSVRKAASKEKAYEIEKYITEAELSKTSKLIDITISEVRKTIKNTNIKIIGVIRGKEFFLPSSFRKKLSHSDILLIEGTIGDFKTLISEFKVELFGTNLHKRGLFETQNKKLLEVIVTEESPLLNKKVSSFRFFKRFDARLIAISKRNTYTKGPLKSITFHLGDILLFYGNAEGLEEIPKDLNCMPLAERSIEAPMPSNILAPSVIFLGALLVTTFGILPLQISFGLAILLMIIFGIISLHEIYQSIDWPIIVLIGSLIAVGNAFESAGMGELIVNSTIEKVSNQHLMVIIALLLVITMTLTDVMNNTATAVIMAPVAIRLAEQLKQNPDAFLMTIAIAASCSFLTPFGHKNNALIMGPGNYKFGDYWRMGLPLEMLIVLVATPLIYYIWL